MTFCAASIGSETSDGFAAQQIQCSVVGNSEEPGTEWRSFGQAVEGNEGLGKCVLHNVFAFDHRPHKT